MHGSMNFFETVPGIHKIFYYHIRVLRAYVNVVVNTHDAPPPRNTPTAHRLLGIRKTPPALPNLTTAWYLPPPLLSVKRLEDLEKIVLGHISRTDHGTPDVVDDWSGVVGGTTAAAPAAEFTLGDHLGGV